MATRRSLVAATGALVGLTLAVATLAASSREYPTFSGTVALPGVTLRAATYSFEVVDYRTLTGVASSTKGVESEISQDGGPSHDALP